MPLYRPSAALRLAIRIDEGRATQSLLSQLEPVSAEDKSQIGKTASGVAADAPREIAVASQSISTLNKLNESTGGADPALAAELERVLTEKRNLARLAHPTGPVAISDQASDGLTIAIGTIPVLRCSIARASFRTGDRASFELNYWDAPFDPRLMRSASVELSIDIISAEEHDAGMHGMRRADGSLYSVVEDQQGVTRATRFLGFVTKWVMEFGDDGPVVRGEAQDVMCVLRKTPLPSNVEIDHDLPIEQGIQALLEQFPALRGMHVVFGTADRQEQGPDPGKAAARRKKKVTKGKSRSRRNAENTNIWDHITDVCVGLGCIPVIDGVTLRIDRARTLYGKQPVVPKMVWGQNLSGLTFTRTMETEKQPTVEVRSFDPDTKRTLAARYPDPHKQGVQSLGTAVPQKSATAPAPTAAAVKAKKVLAAVAPSVQQKPPITIAQYEQQTKTGFNAEYADILLADPDYAP